MAGERQGGAMEIRLLGPVELVAAGGAVPIGSAKQRALLAFLALHPQRLLTYDVLIDGLWGRDPPEETLQALRFHVSRLRGFLRQVDDADRLRTRPGGYQLIIDEDAVDALRFERAIAGARRARSDGAAADAVSRAFRGALDMWVGPALADVDGEPFVVGERRRLEELHLAATEDYLAAELDAGRHADAIGELERLVDRHPLRERLWELLITALYRSGRQADALAAYQRVRRILADDLGIEPSPSLRLLEHKVLLQAADLAPPASTTGPALDAGVLLLTPDAVSVPARTHGEVRRPRGVATTALALGILALGLFSLGVVSTLIALLAIAGGTIATRSATRAGRTTDRRATIAILTGAVALSASLGLLLYRQVTAEGDGADSHTADSETADVTAVPVASETTDRTDPSGGPTREGYEVPMEALIVGDCLNVLRSLGVPAEGAGVGQLSSTVLVVPCDRPHEQEVYHLFSLAPGPYPGDEQVKAMAREQCSAQFGNYVGVAPEESDLDFFYVYPDQPIWSLGIHDGGCSLLDLSGHDLVGSMAGTKR